MCRYSWEQEIVISFFKRPFGKMEDTVPVSLRQSPEICQRLLLCPIPSLKNIPGQNGSGNNLQSDDKKKRD
jgi:hypothetical protein